MLSTQQGAFSLSLLDAGTSVLPVSRAAHERLPATLAEAYA